MARHILTSLLISTLLLWAVSEGKEEGARETAPNNAQVEEEGNDGGDVAPGMKSFIECIQPDCVSPPESGMCRAYFEVFFWNTTSNACDEFGFGGCADGLNCNRYETLESCNKACNKNKA